MKRPDLFAPVATHIVRRRSARPALLALIEPTSVGSRELDGDRDGDGRADIPLQIRQVHDMFWT